MKSFLCIHKLFIKHKVILLCHNCSFTMQKAMYQITVCSLYKIINSFSFISQYNFIFCIIILRKKFLFKSFSKFFSLTFFLTEVIFLIFDTFKNYTSTCFTIYQLTYNYVERYNMYSFLLQLKFDCALLHSTIKSLLLLHCSKPASI